MTASARSRKTKPRMDDVVKRLNALTAGLTVAKVKTNDRELVIEFTDGTRLFVNSDEQLDISVT